MAGAHLSAKKGLIQTVVVGCALVFFPIALHGQSLSGWNLVWSDEFNGTSLDTTKWGLELNEGDPGIGVFTNRPQNLSVSTGCLVLQAQKENYNGKQYTCTQISSKNKASWLYCRVDVRAKLSHGQGLWPAIWMMPQARPYGGWPTCGEVDNMENLGNEPRAIHTTIHFGDTNQAIGYMYNLPASAKSFPDTFHVFTMIWDTGSFAWYIDSVHYTTMNKWSPDNLVYPKPFDQPLFLIFDLAVGGWAGSPDSTTAFPQKMQVDWVRVYQRHGATGLLIPSRTPSQESDICVTASGKVLRFDLKRAAPVSIALYDGAGRKVVSLVNEYRATGKHSLDLASCGVRSGLYLCSMESEGTKTLQKIAVTGSRN